MRKLLWLGLIAGLLLASSATGQDGGQLQPPDQMTLDQQPQQQTPDTTEPGTGGTGEQQVPEATPSGPQIPAEPQTTPPAPQTDQQVGVGGSGDHGAGCQCPDCQMHHGARMGPGGMMMPGPMQFGPRLGELSKIVVENTRDGAVIRFSAIDRKNLEEIQSLAKALGAQWETMGLQLRQRPQQPPPANQPPPAAQPQP